jgi:hypothetical protein
MKLVVVQTSDYISKAQYSYVESFLLSQIHKNFLKLKSSLLKV